MSRIMMIATTSCGESSSSNTISNPPLKCLAHCVFFFFQAEDGIRDGRVTGVQTCALPIFGHAERRLDAPCGIEPVPPRQRLAAQSSLEFFWRDHGAAVEKAGFGWSFRSDVLDRKSVV